MKEKKYFSLPVEFTEIENINQFSSDNGLIPVSMKVMHNGLNLNKSIFSDEVIENAKESLKNRPILGYIKKVDGTDNVDFNGHDVDITFGEDGVKVTYLERPLGCVPESNEYSILEQDNKKYVTCKGYLWEEYLNDGYEILKNNPTKSVSMEIAVNDYEVNNDGTFTVKDYTYLGITILGDSVQAGMRGAEMSIIGQFSNNFSEQFLEKIVDVNSKLFSTQSDSNTESTESQLEQIEQSEFAQDNIEVESEETKVEETIQTEEFTQESQIEPETIVETVDNTKEEFELIKVEFEALKSENQSLKTELSEITTKYNEVVTELNKIYSAEKLERLEEIYSEFDEKLSDVEEYSELKLQSVDMDVEDFENKCIYMLGMKNRSKTSAKKSKTEHKVFSIVGVNIENKNDTDDESVKKAKAFEKYGEAGKYLIK